MGATSRNATGGLTQNPACISNISGWYTRTGGTENDPLSSIRTVVIKWDGTTIGSFKDDAPFTLNGMTGIYAGGYFYVPGNLEIVLTVGVLMMLVELVVLQMEIYATHLM